MNPYLNVLMNEMPPHENAGDRVDWGQVESDYGCRFPEDYKEFIARYGEGSVDECLSVLMPRPSGTGADSVGRLPAATAASASMRLWKDSDSARGFTAEQVLLWGTTSGADALCWWTADEDPQRWPVAVWARHGAGWELFECGMVEFLVKIIRMEFDQCPLSDRALWGQASPRFLHCREEMRLREAGLDPWTGEPDPYAGETFD